MALAGLIENRRQPEGWPNSLRVPEARWNVDRADKGQGYDRTHARDGHQPLTDFIVAREQETLRCSLANFSRKTRRAASKGSIISANSGTPSTRSWIRCSKPTTPTIPTFSPKLRNKPRISFSIARAFSWSIFRAARSALRFWLASVLTCTGRNKPTSLFGRWWSSAFRLTTPIFVARGPALLFGISRWLSQHGISRKRRNNLTRVLIAVERSTQESKANSSHPSSREGHRCAGLWFCRSDSLAFVAQIVGAISLVQRNSVPSLHMRCIITASRRASATMAFFCPRRLGMFIAHAFSHDHFCTRVSMTCAAS